MLARGMENSIKKNSAVQTPDVELWVSGPIYFF